MLLESLSDRHRRVWGRRGVRGVAIGSAAGLPAAGVDGGGRVPRGEAHRELQRRGERVKEAGDEGYLGLGFRV